MIVRSFALLVSSLAIAAFAAEPTQMKPEQTWQGSAKDEEKAKTVPKIIMNAEKLTEAWKACERTDEVPEIDFKKNFVIVLTTRGSRISPRVTLSGAGELRVFGIETRDMRPGFRYVIAVFPREGVKTVNGEALR